MKDFQNMYRRNLILSKEQGRAENEKSQYINGMISFNKLIGKNVQTWKDYPDFHDIVDGPIRDGYLFGMHNRMHVLEFDEHLSHHILNRTGSEKWGDVKHVLVIGSKYPWV